MVKGKNKRGSKGKVSNDIDEGNRKDVKRARKENVEMKIEDVNLVYDRITNCGNHVSHKTLEEWEQSGMMELTLFPLFSSPEVEEDLQKRAAYVIAYLMNYRATSRSSATSTSSSPLSFWNNSDDDSAVSKFIQSLLESSTSSSTATTMSEEEVAKETTIVTFFIHAFASLDREAKWKNVLLEIFATIHLWKCMKNVRYRELELRKNASYRRRWALATAATPTKTDHNKSYNYVAHLLDTFLSLLNHFDTAIIQQQKQNNNDTPMYDNMKIQKDDFDSSSSSSTPESEMDSEYENDANQKTVVVESSSVDENQNARHYQRTLMDFFHQTLQLMIDLLSIAASRRYLRPYLLSVNFTVFCSLSLLPKSSTLFAQLLQMLQELEQFDFKDHRDESNQVDTASSLLSSEMNAAIFHDRAHILQKICHKHHEHSCSDIIFAGVNMICQRPFLESKLKLLDIAILKDLAYRLRLITQKKDEEDCVNHDDKKIIMEILLYHHVLPRSSLEVLKTLPLYPSEKLLWDQHQLPPSLARSRTLALPKLNCQFLTFVDYLLRNFSLVRLESAYGIRSDICDAISRMKPVAIQSYQPIAIMDVEDTDLHEAQNWKNHTRFQGWARMALELHKPVELVQVSPAHLGELIPHTVIAEFAIDLYHCGDAISNEWDSLQEFDNLFLVSVQAPKMNHNLISSNDDNNNNNNNMPFSSEEDPSFPTRFGITAVRGCMVLEIRDEGGNVLTDYSQQSSGENNTETLRKGNKRYFRVALDPAQYALDAEGHHNLGTGVYSTLNVVIRRHGRENNFKAVLETIRGLMTGKASIHRSIPRWLQPVLLGYGDPSSASYQSSTLKEFAAKTVGVSSHNAALDYGDTFLDQNHLRDSFPGVEVTITNNNTKGELSSENPRKNYKISILEESNNITKVIAESYPFCDHPSGKSICGNPVRFTSRQVQAIRSGLSPGLTLIVGPPGTGKTDVAVQIIANLYHSFPSQRTLLITHSNAALNDLFAKVMARGDVDERYMIRLGSGERDLQYSTSFQKSSEFDFTKIGRVNYCLSRRAALLEEVQTLSESLGISGKDERGPDGTSNYTCETAENFYSHHVKKRISTFKEKVSTDGFDENSNVAGIFPFQAFFATKECIDYEQKPLSLSDAFSKISILEKFFSDLREYRPLELLRTQRQRTDYLLTKQVKIVAMTCTHAAIARSHLVELGFQYDNVIMEEAGQMLDVETFIPFLLQKGQSDDASSTTGPKSRLKRICLIGDHNQLPPVVKNMTFSKYSHLDQSLFTRLIRLGVPSIHLNMQGRARPEIASLYSWRYKDLGNLPHVEQAFPAANTGFWHTYQLINVEDFKERGETTPTAYFYQNLGEAEYAVALFQFMILIGYPAEKISILTTYNGQKELISDIITQRCGPGTPFADVRPAAISTVDQYQGQQNDYIILSLVRTKAVGHLRDIRRLVVAVSRARLGLYVLCRQNIFNSCHDLRNTMNQFAKKPNKLELVTGEQFPTSRAFDNKSVDPSTKFVVDDVTVLGSIVHSMQSKLE